MDDIADGKTFDEIEIYRPELARSYLQFVDAQPARPPALFAPRRVGKTFFLDHDLAPLARKAGFTVEYADLWLHRTAPLEAINQALEERSMRSRYPPTPSQRWRSLVRDNRHAGQCAFPFAVGPVRCGEGICAAPCAWRANFLCVLPFSYPHIRVRRACFSSEHICLLTFMRVIRHDL
jgi:hypothetical protein